MYKQAWGEELNEVPRWVVLKARRVTGTVCPAPAAVPGVPAKSECVSPASG